MKKTIIQTGGFTLIEVLVALAVFAILASLTASIMYSSFNTKARVSIQAERLVNLQLAYILLGRDINQITKRAIRTDHMRLSPAFIGQNNYAEFTRSGLTNPNSAEKRSTMKRIGLECKNGKLIRRSWDRLDLVNKKNLEERILITGVKQCKFNYLSKDNQYLNEWRITDKLPKGVMISLALQDWHQLSWLFVLPEGLYA
jgi:general secretion pathway protein J